MKSILIGVIGLFVFLIVGALILEALLYVDEQQNR